MNTCQEYKEWIEEKWEEPIQQRESSYRQECKKGKCKKWCLCCNKWVCALIVAWYWVVKWIIRIIAKWLVYVICRTLAALITLLWAIAFWVKAILCAVAGAKDSPKTSEDVERHQDLKDVSLRPMLNLRLQVVIIDSSKKQNPMTNPMVEARVAAADRILRERAHISVERQAAIRRSESDALWAIEGEGALQGFGEMIKHIAFVLGRESPRHLTVFVVGRIGTNTQGRHYPLYGAVFIEGTSNETTLCHEIGHALLNLDNMAHVSATTNLMYGTTDTMQRDVNWPTNTPMLDLDQWCAMRQSRWLDWVWHCERCF